MLDYKLIEALAMVVREEGFDRAGRALGITQSAVSQRIRSLEEQTGQVLLARTTPPRATPAGRRMLKHYLQVKRLEEELVEGMDQGVEKGFATLSLGLNADSLATWFLEAVGDFLSESRVLLDIRVDDQEQTHRFLKDGEVVGCISTRAQPIQGCRSAYLGRMRYRLLAAAKFAARWFPQGLTREGAARAPALIFNHRDELHHQLLYQILGELPWPIPAHYVPSSERFVDIIDSGLAYGMLPDLQSRSLLEEGRLVDLAPDRNLPVELYWHCWNIRSNLLEDLTRHLIEQSDRRLDR